MIAIADSLIYLTYFGIILLLGLIASIFARKYNIPNFLILIVTGMVLHNITYEGSRLIDFPQIFITTLSLLALVIIVYDGASRFKVKQFDALSFTALRLSLNFMLLNVLLLTSAVSLLFLDFSMISLFVASIFAFIMSGTDPAAMLSLVAEKRNKVISLLYLESVINTPLIVLFPFIVLDLFYALEDNLSFDYFLQQISPFALQIVVGIGVGVMIGLIAFRIMRNNFSPTLSPLAILVTSTLTYILSESLGGNGVLGVTVAGFIFGNFKLKGKEQLIKFSNIFSIILEILVFFLIGFLIDIPFNFAFIFKSIILFIIYVFIRYLSVTLTLVKSDFSFREKLFISLNIPKGIAVAVVASTLFAYVGGVHAIPNLDLVLNLTLVFIIYSLVLSTFVVRKSNYFIKTSVVEK